MKTMMTLMAAVVCASLASPSTASACVGFEPCDTDADCYAGEACIDFECMVVGEEEQEDEPLCTTDADCGAWALCDGGQCFGTGLDPSYAEPDPDQPGFGDPADADATCIADEDCGELAVCSEGQCYGTGAVEPSQSQDGDDLGQDGQPATGSPLEAQGCSASTGGSSNTAGAVSCLLLLAALRLTRRAREV